jgi:hypothetical protein
MTLAAAAAEAEPFDFYAAHYARFDSALSARLRREVYGEDLGQTRWRTAAEQAEIALALELGPGVRLLAVYCSSGGPSLALAERTGCHVTVLDVEPVGVARAKAAAEARAGRADRVPVRRLRRSAAVRGRLVRCGRVHRRVNHLPDRPGTLQEWARLLQPREPHEMRG